MHHSGPLLLTFESLQQGFGGKNCQNGSRGKTLLSVGIMEGNTEAITVT